MKPEKDRNAVERERLRIKRADSDYLKQQRRRRAAQMRATRVKRKAAGKCRECEARALKDRAYCRRHLLYERGRTKQAPTGTAAPIHSQP